MVTAVHRATRDVAPEEAPRNGVLSGRDLIERLPTEDVETSMGTVRVHGLGAYQMITIGPQAREVGDTNEEQARFMVEVVGLGLGITTDEAGMLPWDVIKSLFDAVSRLSGINERAVQEAVADLKAPPSGES